MPTASARTEPRAAFPNAQGHTVHDSVWQYQVLFDQLEWQFVHGAQGLRWDSRSWVGGDRNRVWVKSEGEAVDGSLDEAEAQVLYGGRSRDGGIGSGVRLRRAAQPAHTWLAIGIQGLAPQWFEIEADRIRRHVAATPRRGSRSSTSCS